MHNPSLGLAFPEASTLVAGGVRNEAILQVGPCGLLDPGKIVMHISEQDRADTPDVSFRSFLKCIGRSNPLKKVLPTLHTYKWTTGVTL